MSKEDPSAIYFANRANVKLEIHNYIGCIQDCDQAIQIDPKYIKSYMRKARALHILTKFQEALEAVRIGLELDPQNQEF